MWHKVSPQWITALYHIGVLVYCTGVPLCVFSPACYHSVRRRTSLFPERQKIPLVSWVISLKDRFYPVILFFLYLLASAFPPCHVIRRLYSVGDPSPSQRHFLGIWDAWMPEYWPTFGILDRAEGVLPVLSFLEVIDSPLLETVCFLTLLQLPRAPLFPSGYLFGVNYSVTHWVTSKKEDRKRRLGELRLPSGEQVKKACP